MKKAKQGLSILLLLALFLNFTAPSMAAENDSSLLSMTVSQERAVVGDSVAVTVAVEQAFSACGVGLTICYDPAVLELLGAETTAAAPFAVHGPLQVGGKTVVRISFLPTEDPVTLSAGDVPAVLQFRALQYAESTAISMTAAYLYDEQLTQIPLTRPEDVLLPVEASDTMGSYTVSLPSETVAADGDTIRVPVIIGSTDEQTDYNAFDITFAYDAAVLEPITTRLSGLSVTVEEGTVRVLGYGESRPVDTAAFTLEFRLLQQKNTHLHIIEARVDHSGNAVGQNAALATVTRDSMEITAAGYPVTLPEGFVGQAHAAPDADYTFRIPDDYYNYTVTAAVNGAEIPLTDNGDGSYTIAADQITGAIIITAVRTGKVFRVALGEDMTGASTAQHGEDYTATLHKNHNYRYTVTVYIGGREYTGYAVYGGSYTIPGVDIIGDVVFRVQKTPVYTPPAPGPDEPDEPNEPTPDTPEPDEPTPDEPTPDEPTPDEPTPDGPTPDDPVPDVPDPVVTHTVTFSGSGAGAAQGNGVSVTDGGTYVLTLRQEAGYVYHVSYVMGGDPVELKPDADGSYTIGDVSADLEIIIEKQLQLELSVQSYLTMDEQNVYLICVHVELEDGKAVTFDGHTMYYSEAYGAWTWLVIADRLPELQQLQQLVGIAAQADRVVRYAGCDVDRNGQVDTEDMQLILDLYNAGDTDFEEAAMPEYLHADVNGDGTVDVRDAAAVVWAMQNKEDGHQ